MEMIICLFCQLWTCTSHSQADYFFLAEVIYHILRTSRLAFELNDIDLSFNNISLPIPLFNV